jgi:hypothetical protein
MSQEIRLKDWDWVKLGCGDIQMLRRAETGTGRVRIVS